MKPRFYLDANVVISTVEQSDIFGPAHRRFIEGIDAEEIEAMTSELTLAECLVKPVREANEVLIRAYLTFLDGRPSLPLLAIDRDILLAAARLAASLKVKLPDAIHVATAVRAGATSFLTNDRRIRVPETVKIVWWDEL